MQKLVATGLGVVLSMLVGCAAPMPETEETKASSTSRIQGDAEQDEITRVLDIPIGASSNTRVLRYRSSFEGQDSIKAVCGGDFGVDVSVQFGRVTAKTLLVRSVTVTYRSGKDAVGEQNQVMPVLLNFFTDESWNAPYDWTSRPDGSREVVPVNRTFTVEEGQPLNMDFKVGTGLPGGDSADWACINSFRAVFYPEAR